jgi:hypothetical protein
MKTGHVRTPYLIPVYLFAGFTLLFAAGWLLFSRRPVDFEVLLAGNLLIFLLSLYSLRLGTKALLHESVQVFLRLVYGSLFLKLFILALAAFLYIIALKKDLNKPALFGCFALYLIYTFTEVRLVMQQGKRKNV